MTTHNSSDYHPYDVVSQQPQRLTLQLKKSHRLIRIFLYRLMPLFVLAVLAISFETMQKDMPPALFALWCLTLAAVALYLLFSRYDTAITISHGKIEQRFSSLFAGTERTLTINRGDTLQVKQERGGRSLSWVFYRVNKQGKTRIMRLPIFLSDNLASRNNFMAAFANMAGLSVDHVETR